MKFLKFIITKNRVLIDSLNVNIITEWSRSQIYYKV